MAYSHYAILTKAASRIAYVGWLQHRLAHLLTQAGTLLKAGHSDGGPT